MQYLIEFEKKLEENLLRHVTNKGFLKGQLLEAEELNEKWHKMAPEYMVDAVPEIIKYPTVAVAWAGYVGMALAVMWDSAWDKFSVCDDLYLQLRTPRGFDAMDEYIIEEVLGLKLGSKEGVALEDLLRECAEMTVSMIRAEQIEPQSTEAFHIFARAVVIFFKIGVAVELQRLGYKYEKVLVDIPQYS